jgi:hypothetical protein
MSNKTRITLIAVCFFIYFGYFGLAISQQALAQIPNPIAQAPDAKNPSPELVGKLTKELSITPEQAIGGSGALFGLAKSRLNPGEFAKISGVVPGMDGLLKAAPKQESGGPLGAISGALPGKAGGLASVAGSFKSLGLSPDMASKFVPIMTKFVEAKGGASVGNMLAGALK